MFVTRRREHSFVSMAYVAIALTGVSFALYGTMMGLFVRAMFRRRPPCAEPAGPTPRVTVFKPLAGCDDDLEDNLESFAKLDYPSLEILLGVADPSDAAFAAARRFVARHPSLDARIVLTDRQAALNPKVAQLIGLERQATGAIYVISDSNVRVAPSYLRSLVSDLAQPGVGMVTSLFGGTGERTLGAALENLQICVSTAPGIAALDAVSNRPFTVGKSMAVRRGDLERLGGFAPVGNVLAEDHVLGRRFMDAGFITRTSYDLIENRNVGCSLARTLERHTRWAQMRRSLFPVAFVSEPLLTPVVVTTAMALVCPSRLSAALFVTACTVQTACAFLAVRLVRGRNLPLRYAPLEIVRSYVSFMCWARAYVTRRIAWRGHPFRLLKGSFILPLSASPGAARERTAGDTRLPA